MSNISRQTVHAYLVETASSEPTYLRARDIASELVGVTGSMNWGMENGMGSGMGGGMTGGRGSTIAGMGWDLGMVALAVLMLISGVIMMNAGTGDVRT